MSSALLRRTLEIVDSDHKSKERNKSRKSKGVFDLISSNHRNFKSVGRGGKIEKKAVYNVEERSSKKLKEILKPAKSKVEENLKKLRILASTTLQEDVTQKIIKRARAGKAVVEIEEEKPEEGTVFTEEDFQKFEKDLFCS